MLYSQPLRGLELKKVGSKDYRDVLAHSHLGVMFLLIVGGSIFGGLKADEALGSSPAGVLLGLAFGFALGFYYMLVQLFGDDKESEDQSEGD